MLKCSLTTFELRQPPQMFFFQSNADPSLDHLYPAILTSPNAEDLDLSEATADYLGYLDLATHLTQESAISDDFATATLKLLGINE
ncbi:hypothetical protein CPB84DRAFT_1879320 [Gymnopilus junonius]|uniref:Uncharacterized protein n=1 Tax=Gymnopilus junonius TaxID=109634 RepID=A0A9P5NDY9_GYMJU|nr:hypothetical protein CPB84DRAFT_1879320 [Gymnopilus junonius]